MVHRFYLQMIAQAILQKSYIEILEYKHLYSIDLQCNWNIVERYNFTFNLMSQ